MKLLENILNKDEQALTGGMFYCRDSAGFSVSALYRKLTVICSVFGNKNIPPNRIFNSENYIP